MPNNDTHEASETGKKDGELFIDKWISENRENEELNSDILDIVDNHRNGDNLDDSSLLIALINYTDTQSSKEDEKSN